MPPGPFRHRKQSRREPGGTLSGGAATGMRKAMAQKIHRPRRAALYVPASNAKAMSKIASLDPDVVIYDLEDAVGPYEKAAAREAMRA
ncbi:MAG: aldolase/citrate lyase family protein, partial [Rhizobiaceae bacterium]